MGPETPLSALVEEVFKVCNNQDLMDSKNKRLMKQFLAALIHPPPPGDPGGPRRLERPPRSHPGPISVSFVRKEGNGRGNVLNAPSVGCWRGNPNQPSFLANLSQMRDSLALTNGVKSLPTSRSHSTHLHYSIGSPSMWRIRELNFL